MSVRSGEPTPSPKVRLKPTSRGPAALGVGGSRDVGRPEGLHRVLEEVAADAVAEERHGFRAVLGLDPQHAFGDVLECLVPDRFRSTLPPRAGAGV